jgi:hypothetical protein
LATAALCSPRAPYAFVLALGRMRHGWVLAGGEIHIGRRRIAHTLLEESSSCSGIRFLVAAAVIAAVSRAVRSTCTKVSGWLCGHDDVRRAVLEQPRQARGHGGKALTLSNSTPTPQGWHVPMLDQLGALAADELPSTHGPRVRANASSMCASVESCGGSSWLTG